MFLSKKTINRCAWTCATLVILAILTTLAILFIQNRAQTQRSQNSPAEAVPDPADKNKIDSKIQKSLEDLAPETMKNTDAPLNEPVPEEKVAETIQQAAEETLAEVQQQAAQRTPEENQNRLAHQGYLLNKVSSEESVDEIAQTFAEEQGLKPRAAEPSLAPPEGPFDIDTAQIHDCEEIRNDDGSVRYVATMFDAQGRTMTVEMAEAEGKQLYRTMRLINSNPLMEKVYRSMVVPLLDKKVANPSSRPQEN